MCRLHRIYHNYHHHTNGFSFHSSVVYVAIEADLIDILKVPSSELRITGVIGGRLKLFVIGVLERRSLHKRSLVELLRDEDAEFIEALSARDSREGE